ncbi:MAG: FAD-binding protein [Pseudomonadota bacterium]|nr:FAD-binding protein [Pseudomonadota bacterium]
MIRDLAEVPASAEDIAADVLVIGAGIAGLLIATRLARAGRRVFVAESGGLTQFDDIHPLNEVEQLGDIYAAAVHGRFRCLGGTSTRWGGAMLPFQPADLAPHSAGWNVDWPVSLDTLIAYQSEVERLFKLGSGPYDVPDIMSGPGGSSGRFMGRLAKGPAFRLRNVATLLAADIHAKGGPDIWLNATATSFVLDPAGRVAKVKMRSGNGNTLSVAARETVIAAGAIEATRLLLITDRQHDHRIFAPDNVLGRYLHDHLSMPVASSPMCGESPSTESSGSVSKAAKCGICASSQGQTCAPNASFRPVSRRLASRPRCQRASMRCGRFIASFRGGKGRARGTSPISRSVCHG